MQSAVSTDPSTDGCVDPSAAAYQARLIDAVERYVSDKRKESIGGLSYRGADFGRAIAIDLYFGLVNDGAFREVCRKHMETGARPAADEGTSLSPKATMLLPYMTGDRTGWSGRLRKSLRRNIASVVDWSGTGTTKPSASQKPSVKGRVAFLAITGRFADYLSPIERQLSAPALWIAAAKSPLKDRLAENGRQVVTYDFDDARTLTRTVRRQLTEWPSLAAQFDVMRDVLSRHDISTIVMAEGTHPIDEIVNLAARSLGIRTVCIQQGWSPVVHNGFREMRFDAFCVWGAQFARMLELHNPAQAFFVTGNHVIGPGGGADRSEKSAISFFLQHGSVLITEEAWQNMLRLVSWTAERFSDRKILVREHPAIPIRDEERAHLASLSNVEMSPATERPLADVLDESLVAVAIFSTTLIEAVVRGAVPLIVNVTGIARHHPDLEQMGLGVEVHDYDAAREALERLVGGEAQRIRNENGPAVSGFFSAGVAQATRNITAVIENSGEAAALMHSRNFENKGAYVS